MNNKEKLFTFMRTLSYKAFKLYILMTCEKEGYTKSMDYKERYIELFQCSDYTFYEARRELLEKRLIKC